VSDARQIHVIFTLVAATALAMSGCAGRSVAGSPQKGRTDREIASAIRALADARFTSAGCSVASSPQVGMSRVHIWATEWRLYDCRSISKPARDAAHRIFFNDAERETGGATRTNTAAMTFTVNFATRVCGTVPWPTVRGTRTHAGFWRVEAPGGSSLGDFWFDVGPYTITFHEEPTCATLEFADGDELPLGESPR